MVQYYWVEGKNDLLKLERLLIQNDISYFVKNEYMKIRMKNEVHQQRKDIYLVFIDDKQLLEAEELIDNQCNCIYICKKALIGGSVIKRTHL